MSANRWATPPSPPWPDWSATWSQPATGSPSGESGAEVPLCCHWGDGAGERPVPTRVLLCRDLSPAVSSLQRRRRVVQNGYPASLLWPRDAAHSCFDLTAALRQLIQDIVARLPELAHIRLEQVHIGVTRSRRRRTGLLARITPMRFPGGQLWLRCGTELYTLQRYWLGGVELLYLIAFCVPRFLDLSFDEKMVTILHELCHISPTFDGDLHRHAGRYCLHTHSKKAYDRRMAILARAYLDTKPDERLLAFLRQNSRELLQRYPALIAEWLPNPRILRWSTSAVRDHG